MAEAKNYVFDYQELAEILVKQQSIHEGLWGIYLEFGFAAANLKTDPNSAMVMPGIMNLVQKIGIQQFPEANNLTVDAAKVNPSKTAKSRKRQNRR
ncbi:MAG: hypothetical protein M3R52_02110 [Acidobacteriota bacterium]|nr:hypothetical protein [Acidobacteriota bacterium]